MRAEVDAEPPSNLVLPRTSVVGRERELAAVVDLLGRDEVGLVTLLGPGGSGKTRLALEVAATLRRDAGERFADGVFFVDLAPIGDPGLVVLAIVAVLGVQEMAGRPALVTLQDYLRHKRLLLLLDNFEQVRSAAPHVSALLGACPGLKLLVTSRVPLNLRDERDYPVPPLAHPSEAELGSASSSLSRATRRADEVLRFPAVQLFCQRATAVRPDFRLDDENADAVARICARLDGLPLALELAAARVKHLSPRAMLARLERRLPLLTGGPQDLPERQRTMREAIDWSYHLLGEGEKTLFRWLGVFVGGFTLLAAEQLCRNGHGLPADALDGVAALLDASLLRDFAPAPSQSDGRVDDFAESRFTMLETIREYALERLEAHGEAEAAREEHARLFLQLTEEAEPHLRRQEQMQWVARIRRDYDNVRTALEWGAQHPESEVGLRMAAALYPYWLLRGETPIEGHAWTRRVLEGAVDRRSLPYARALMAASVAEWLLGNYRRALADAEESARVLDAAGDERELTMALHSQSLSLSSLERLPEALAVNQEAVRVARSQPDRWALAIALHGLGIVHLDRGALDLSRAAFEESRDLFRKLGDSWGLMVALRFLAIVVQRQGDHAQAAAMTAETVLLAIELENAAEVARGQQSLGYLADLRGDPERSARHYGEAASTYRRLGLEFEVAACEISIALLDQIRGEHERSADRLHRALTALSRADHRLATGLCLLGYAGLADSRGQPARAGRLLAAARQLLSDASLASEPTAQALANRVEAATRARLGPDTFEGLLAGGAETSSEAAIAYALEAPSEPESAPAPLAPTSRQRAKQDYGGLTDREREVARLIVEGKSNREIAEELVVGVKTVEAHVTRILTKLGFTSRAQIAAWAVDRGLAVPPKQHLGRP